MEFNLTIFIVAAFTTLITGFIWYHPKVFGTVWMREAGLTEEQLNTGNMLKIFGFTILFSLALTTIMMTLTIHQMGALGMIGGPTKASEALPSYSAFMNDYGSAFRSFKHGALHGFISGLFFAFPIIAINGLFERKSWKYIFIHSGYWILTLTLMGGIICSWA